MAGGIRGAIPAGLVLTGLVLTACKQPPIPPSNVVLRVTTTRGAPVEGAEVRLGNALAGRSDNAGSARIQIGGSEGDSFELRVHCPPPLRSPAQPLVVRRLDIHGGEAVHAVKCEETRRTLLVVIRADNGPELPILWLGKVVGRTDRSGAAHVKIDADIHERVELMLSTAQKETMGVHPQNPVAAFEPADHDEIQEFSVTFTRDVKKRPPKPRPVGPIQF